VSSNRARSGLVQYFWFVKAAQIRCSVLQDWCWCKLGARKEKRILSWWRFRRWLVNLKDFYTMTSKKMPLKVDFVTCRECNMLVRWIIECCFFYIKNKLRKLFAFTLLVDWNIITPLATHHPEPHWRVLIPTLSHKKKNSWGLYFLRVATRKPYHFRYLATHIKFNNNM
jgi:hypothetical protein